MKELHFSVYIFPESLFLEVLEIAAMAVALSCFYCLPFFAVTHTASTGCTSLKDDCISS